MSFSVNNFKVTDTKAQGSAAIHPLGEDAIKTHRTVMRYAAPGKEQCGDQHKAQFTTALDLPEQ